MGFQLVSKASDARSLLDCVALTTPSKPARAVDQPSIRNSNDKPDTAVQLASNPVLMPWVGFGTYRLGQRQSRSATYHALDAGYRNIDTAFIYGGQTTEIEVGKAINDAIQNGIITDREELFVTTKQWREYHGYDKSLQCLDLSLERLGMDYVDCWMMHWPGPCWESKPRQERDQIKNNRGSKRSQEENDTDMDPWKNAKEGMGKDEIIALRAETWRAMEDAYRLGKTRSIAVSNFTIQHLESLKQSATLWPPAINQIECHPYYPQNDLLEYCKKEGIVVQAYAALGGQDGTKAKWKELGGKLLESPPVVSAASKLSNPLKKVTPAQVLLRWALQRNCAIVPKTSSPVRMKENANVFDFILAAGDMEAISNLSSRLENEVSVGRLCWRTEPLRMLDFN
mmetsp:Transcript_26301/g.54895  ORF Transcript_26301/g.54895 Transcript_26301/m.54895 type:complete len:398 (+) Transcript_26301:203-1396(+)